MTIAELTNTLASSKAFFFAGAGISIESKMPSVNDILRRTANVFLPNDPSLKTLCDNLLWGGPSITSHGKLQPELFYEVILSVFQRRDCLRLWEALTTTAIESCGGRLYCNENHAAIVSLSFSMNAPILTTNFDNLFEKAAEEQGLPFTVIRPQTTQEARFISEWSAENLMAGQLYIYKLHGCASDIASISTTMTSITSVNFRLLHLLELLFANKSAVLCGYSGSDIDIFPHLASHSSAGIFWFDPFRDISPDRTSFANATVINETPSSYFKRQFPMHVRTSPTRPASGIRNCLDWHENWLRSNINPADAERYLVLFACLYSGGRAKEAFSIYQTFLRPIESNLTNAQQVLCGISLTRVLDVLSKYETGVSTCVKLLKSKKLRNLSSPETRRTATALIIHRQAMLRKQQIGPNINYQDTRLDWRPNAIRAVLELCLLSRDFVRIQMWLRRTRFDRSEPMSVQAWHGALDHEILLFAGVDAAVNRIPGRGFRLWRSCRNAWLSSMRIRAEVRGDFFSLAGVMKYQTTSAGRSSEQAEYVYKMITNPLNRALLWRNVGVAALSDGKSDEARRAFVISYRYAKLAGSPPTQLKAAAGLVATGVRASALLARVGEWERDIEGRGYMVYINRLRCTL